MTRIKPSKEAVLGIDIGGTSIKWAVYPLINGKMGEEAIEKGKIPTKESPTDKAVPLEKHVSDVAALIRDAGVAANKRGYSVVSTGIASPGKFIDDENGGKKIEPGSSPNMGAEFDNANLQQRIEAQLKEMNIDMPIAVMNDAAAQQLGIIEALLKQEGMKEKLLGKTVGFMGLGTGLGGSFATISKEGKVEQITDGHLSDLMVKLSPADSEIVVQNNGYCDSGNQFELNADNSRVKGDDMLSAKAVNRFTGLDMSSFAKPAAASTVATYGERLAVMGHSIAQIAKQVQEGDITKQHDYQTWPEKDVDAARDTSVWLLSGGLMENANLGPKFLHDAEHHAQTLGVEGVEFLRAPVQQAAERAAAAAAPLPQKERVMA